jgi:hypothetical protein
MTSHTGTSMAAPAWGAFDHAPSPAGRRVRPAERAGETALRLRVRGGPGRALFALGALLALWAVLWTVFLTAVVSPATSAWAALAAEREATRPQVASAAGSRP